MSDKSEESGEKQELTEASLEEASGGSGRRNELDHVGAYNFTVEIKGTSGAGSGVNELSMDDTSGTEKTP